MVVVTTSQDQKEQIELGQKLATEIGCPFVLRKQQRLSQMMRDLSLQGIIVVETQQVTLQTREGPTFYFHPNMVKHRAHAFLKDQPDVMVKAMNLEPGLKVLDCTLGLGSDALITSLVVGKAGQVVGLEASTVIAVLVKNGLRNYPWESLPVVGKPLAEAANRIEVVNQDHREVLKRLPANSFDIVYFDPMFQETIPSSKGIAILRHWGWNQTLDPRLLLEAARVARKRVVVKVKRGSQEFNRLGLRQVIEGGRRISYGILSVKEG